MPGHTTLADAGDLADDAATGHPVGSDFLLYLDILRALDEQSAAVNSALLAAHTADTAPQRRTALTSLHSRLRDMAATANDALGNWPERSDVPA
ncbi:hypothetical protein GCM10010172_31700 [Paractinoplanes ferrugineus]|uniref:Uncharacterized protein n=1 Tax=Paractinoplanes ferrugineus TaxID=113564 RepID=A0A919J529_9ACTN|nr:hypothetical protein [Actinoplanes ferrugineus]GIE14138.1 hypothetical protein Afe05nite_59780 [Actinoplanes ferrugineus]